MILNLERNKERLKLKNNTMETIAIGTIVRLNSNRYDNYRVMNVGTLNGAIIYELKNQCPGWETRFSKPNEFSVYMTIGDMLEIQKEHLSQWRLRLNDTVYNALEAACLESNKGQIEPYEIKRGQSLDTFIANWRPNRAIKDIYW